MTEYYTLSSERTQEIGAAGGFTPEQVREIALTDWPEGDEHQQFLDAAPAEEVADWVAALWFAKNS